MYLWFGRGQTVKVRKVAAALSADLPEEVPAPVALRITPPSPVPQRHFPAHKALPRPPRDLMEGACVGSPHPDAWAAGADPADAILAAITCAGCHVLLACREWSLHLPQSDLAIYGGWGAPDRERERRARAGRPIPFSATTAGKNAARQRRRAQAAAA